jgi:sulfite reductase alpha subunit-like flavoprotein
MFGFRLQAMSSPLLDSCTSSNEGSLPSVLQVQEVDELAASLENFSLADISVRNEVAVQNAVQCVTVQESTRNLDTVEVNSLTSNALGTGKQLPAATHDDRSFFREQLKSLECPFNWELQNLSMRDTPELLISRVNEKVEEIEEDTFQWRKLNLMLVLCYEHFRKGDTSMSWAKQRLCEQILNPSEPKGEYENFFHATKNALLHVMNSCKCHLLFETGVLNEARQLFQKVHKFEEMDSPCKAAIWGIRASVSMEYGYEGTKVRYIVH